MITWTRNAGSDITGNTDGSVEWEWRSMTGDEPTRWLWNTGSRLDSDSVDSLFDEAATSARNAGR